MLNINDFIENTPKNFEILPLSKPWNIIEQITDFITAEISNLNDDFIINYGIAIHKTAKIDPTATIKAPAIIGANSFIGQHVMLRNGVYLGENCTIGAGCEIKCSLILNHSAVAHFNFVGDSIIGSNVNFEGGSLTANHYNERDNKEIFVLYNDNIIKTGCIKFGALVGDNSKIGANAVLSPGTLLQKNSVVKRLELVEQIA